MVERFHGSFTRSEPVPEEGAAAALEVMREGVMHRYDPDAPGHVRALEAEFAAFTGAPYVLAVASGGAAMALALRAAGVQPGDAVLTNAFTLAPVPGAIASVGARPVLVETTRALTIDLADLAAKAGAARVLLLSHMRGHIPDMGALMALCRTAGITVIEDCAHSMGATASGLQSGRHGALACYSTQSYKHIDSGEGGLIAGSDPGLMARAVLLSGSYMYYGRHDAVPPASAFEGLRYELPNVSSRMDELRAAILRPQLAALPARCERWRARHRVLEAGLKDVPGLELIAPHPGVRRVGSSLQILLPGWSAGAIEGLLARCAARGVTLRWFGAPEPDGFVSRYDSWHYVDGPALPRTDAVLRELLDMRVPLAFSLDDCAQIARIIAAEVAAGMPPVQAARA